MMSNDETRNATILRDKAPLQTEQPEMSYSDDGAVRGSTDAAGQDRLRLSHLSRRTSGRLRRSALVTLRWIAVGGQAITLLIIAKGFGYSYPYVLAAIMVLTSAALNLAVSLWLPLDRRVGSREAILQLGFDTLQLTGLLWLTGGMNNPFSLLYIAPVVTGATTLSKRVLFSIGTLGACASLFLLFNHLPLPWSPAGSFVLPQKFMVGMWLALITGMIFTSVYTWQAAREGRRMSEALAATEAVLAHEQKLTALGGLAAAAAHELGTPLATIQLVAKEMARELDAKTALGEDAQLLVQQTQRCREILKQLAARGDAAEPMHDLMTLDALLSEAAQPYIGLGSDIEIITQGKGEEPDIRRQAEILFGLKNFVENAVEFAKGHVILTGRWTKNSLTIIIEDDGPGFDPTVRARLGEPYVSVRGETNEMAGGLGLGFFIAKTLIERTGGHVSFDNRGVGGGACVKLAWPLEKIAA
jgi:two-component system sensor histidine kinase RegB